MVALTLFLLLFVGMALGLPIAVALGFSSMTAILLFTNDSMASIALKLFEAVSEHYTLLAIPFFILSSSFLSSGGVARRLIDFATAAIGHVRGGLAMASVLACMLFAAVSGSSPATVAAVGSIVLVGMVRAGYPLSFAAGAISTAGTLGILIPPSIVMLVYSAATEVSASRMFMAGFVPGILIGLILMVTIYIVARRKNLPAEPFVGFTAILKAAWSASGGLMLIILVLGSIYAGVASPTEAAAVAAVYGFLVAIWGYRDIGPLKGQPWHKDGENTVAMLARNMVLLPVGIFRSVYHPEVGGIVRDAARVSITLLFIIANAMLFAHVLTSEQIPHQLAATITDWGLPAWGFLIVMNILLLMAGNFMEPSAILLIMAPILLPIALQLGIDPIHLGIIMVVNMELGMLTPPVGLNLFVTAGITGKSIGWAIKACAPWLLLMLVCLIAITFIPEISLWLPNYLDGL
ncbi:MULTISPECIES: TRAP transporter large permease [unclassified Oceanobacter]|jgi:C4-dicarboxylate transporter DctM subunit|uniref:TRAP transporter large permease n=1 Tax=unclassified Oceanobacter TaxID=2620260 RepID=UPI00273298C9|nr:MULTISPECIES: TRAP transporter large permease subunit [unclassified Oceanobacter]MDP2546553.1 TRAP transporter large permease subunit [Oceanobacter sp. 4_MG-2023]MDP2610305.1 TRAP transporter large permease subunit [Oceanobacter sp. 1_MG-2023]MDP2613557.1 TRAP transporter large permease subunit [Oceanobacter sp. 2_MG-2023]